MATPFITVNIFGQDPVLTRMKKTTDFHLAFENKHEINVRHYAKVILYLVERSLCHKRLILSGCNQETVKVK